VCVCGAECNVKLFCWVCGNLCGVFGIMCAEHRGVTVVSRIELPCCIDICPIIDHYAVTSVSAFVHDCHRKANNIFCHIAEIKRNYAKVKSAKESCELSLDVGTSVR